ncbi:MAG: thioredoxin domain-containing protein [Desulfobacterales bacterium]
MNKIPNHLIKEKSPYLMQHAYNPVDWYPWGEEAFARAEKENKPVLLSIGYSTCHWCHVMEKESFTDPAVALIMNKNFICIKVDREERPDIDRIYISAVTALAGSAGWPLNVFLTPKLKPFFGGTYFPGRSRFGITSWSDLLNKIAVAWNDPVTYGKIIGSADALTGVLETNLSQRQKIPALKQNRHAHLEKAFEYYLSVFDEKSGGFGKAPKFPSPSILNFLLAYHSYGKKAGNAAFAEKALQIAVFTLKAMARGGIYDQIGGGFHRYSTDEKWHIPHFEKMLYDNAQLIPAYLEAYRITSDDSFAAIAQETAGYVLRDMRSPERGFYSAEDADSIPNKPGKISLEEAHEKIEGAFYVWSRKELNDILGVETAEIFSFHFGVLPGGNAEQDPHGYFEGKNILHVKQTVEETAEKFHLSEEKTVRILNEAKNKLYQTRIKKIRPHLDDKILTSWNGLMISALCKAFQVLGDKKYLEAAKNAAEFILSALYDEKTGKLFRRWRDGEKNIFGMGSDYAFLISGLIDLYETDFESKWLETAVLLSEEHLRLFYDTEHGGFYMTGAEHDKNLILRVKDDSDSVIASSGSVAIRNLLRLSVIKSRIDFAQAAEKSIETILSGDSFHPASFPNMLAVLCDVKA